MRYNKRLSSLEHKPQIHSFVHSFIRQVFIKHLVSVFGDLRCKLQKPQSTALITREFMAYNRKSTHSCAGFLFGLIQQFIMSKNQILSSLYPVSLGIVFIQTGSLTTTVVGCGQPYWLSIQQSYSPTRSPTLPIEAQFCSGIRYQCISLCLPKCGC